MNGFFPNPAFGWAFALHCKTEGLRKGYVEWGNSAKQAIVNVYKEAVGPDTAYAKHECKIQGFTTGNGSHRKYKQEKEE